MTWLTNSITWVECNDPRHVGDPKSSIETGYMTSCRDALTRAGWGYDHDKNYHVCGTCVTRNIVAGRARLN